MMDRKLFLLIFLTMMLSLNIKAEIVDQTPSIEKIRELKKCFESGCLQKEPEREFEDTTTLIYCSRANFNCEMDTHPYTTIITNDYISYITYVIAFEFAKSSIPVADEQMILEVWDRLFSREAEFKQYKYRTIKEITIIGHTDIVDTKRETHYEGSQFCMDKGVGQNTNECLGILRAQEVKHLLENFLETKFSEQKLILENVSAIYHQDPFLKEESTDIPFFLERIGAAQDKVNFFSSLEMPLKYSSSTSIRERLGKKVGRETHYLLRKFRSVVMVVRFSN